MIYKYVSAVVVGLILISNVSMAGDFSTSDSIETVDQGGSCEYKTVWVYVESCRNKVVDGRIFRICSYEKKQKRICVK
jgi:hypothetical protein